MTISAFADSCPGSIIENGPDILIFAAEAQEGNYNGLGSFVSSMGDICEDCDLECDFLKQLSAHHIVGAAIGCISGIANSIEGATQTVASGGIDVFGDL